MKKKFKVKKASGKLGVLIPGISGAVSTTFIAGILAKRKNLGELFGSLSQMGTLRLGKRTDKKSPLIKDVLSLADINDIEFFGWDVYGDNCYKSCKKSGVLDINQIESIKDELEKIVPQKAVFNKKFATNLKGKNIK